MVQRAGRITCPNCGANNFDTVTTCYRCNASLITGAVPSPAAPPAGTPALPDRRPNSKQPAMNVPMNAPLNAPMNTSMNAPSMPPMMAAPPPMMMAGAPAYNYGGGDPGMARRAAVLLALTIPWIGLPVGWIFMMMEDQKRQAIGRYCANWSMIALVFHLLLSFVFMQSLAAYLPMALNLTKSLSQGQQNQPRDTGVPGMP